MKIYIAGKWEDRHIVKAIMKQLKEQGYEITEDWTDHDDPTRRRDYAILDLDGVRRCDVLLALCEKEYPYKGLFCEVGAAIALGKPVYVLGHVCDSCIFWDHPLVEVLEPSKEEGE